MAKPITIGVVLLIRFGDMLPVPDRFGKINGDRCMVAEGCRNRNDELITNPVLQIIPSKGEFV